MVRVVGAPAVVLVEHLVVEEDVVAPPPVRRVAKATRRFRVGGSGESHPRTLACTVQVRRVSVVLPNGEIAETRIPVSASESDAKKAKDAAWEKGDLNLGRPVPAHVAILRKKEGTGGGHELVDVDEPGRLVPAQETLAKEVKYLIDRGHLRLFLGTRTIV